jgi:hypothetical protein
MCRHSAPPSFPLKVRLSQISGAPLGITKCSSVKLGDVMLRHKEDEALSSFVEADLELVKERFSQTLNDRRTELDTMMRESLSKENKSEEEKDRESHLIAEWMALVKERDAILKPEVDSGLPGALDSVQSEVGYERRNVVIYNPLDRTAPKGVSRGWADVQASFLPLHIISTSSTGSELEVTCSWDAAAHDNAQLLRPTVDEHRIYVRLQITLPVDNSDTEIILNKILCFKVFKHSHSFKPTLRDRFGFSAAASKAARGCGVTVQVISAIPTFDKKVEVTDESERESVANDYQRNVESMRNLARIDRLRQQIVLQEALALPRPLSRRATPGRLSVSSIGSDAHALAASAPSADMEKDIAGRVKRLEQALDAARRKGDVKEADAIRKRLEHLINSRDANFPRGFPRVEEEEWVVVDDKGHDFSPARQRQMARTMATAASLDRSMTVISPGSPGSPVASHGSSDEEEEEEMPRLSKGPFSSEGYESFHRECVCL